MWNPDELAEYGNSPDAVALIEASEVYDAEPAIAALRRNYVLARLDGWEPTAALRIACKNVLAIIDAPREDKPRHLEIVK
jgi:hypothetical protein